MSSFHSHHHVVLVNAIHHRPLSLSLLRNPFKPSEWTFLIFPLLLIECKTWIAKPLNQTIFQALFSLQVMVPMMLALTFWIRGITELLPFQLLLYSPPSLLFLVPTFLALLWVTFYVSILEIVSCYPIKKCKKCSFKMVEFYDGCLKVVVWMVFYCLIM